nr:MAG TPA: hypothetical protein [Bacteriophage sp.]
MCIRQGQGPGRIVPRLFFMSKSSIVQYLAQDCSNFAACLLPWKKRKRQIIIYP